MPASKVAVYGATGFTGRLIADGLAHRGVPFLIGGRNEESLEELAEQLGHTIESRPEIAVASVDEPHELDAMLSGVEVLINCAGPFAELGKPVVEAALRMNTHYLDTTGEQVHIRWIADVCHEQAEASNVVLMPACAFEFALGDLAAEAALAKAASRIVVAYAVTRAKMSPGTKKSLVRSMSTPGLTFVGGHHESRRTGYRLFDVPFPDGTFQKGVWVAGGEAITVPRRGGVSTVETCVVVDGGKVHLAAPLLGLVAPLIRLAIPIADRIVDTISRSPHEAPTKGPQFLVIAFDPKTLRPQAILRGADMYATTANIAVEAAKQLLDDAPIKAGFVGPADLFDPADFLESIGVEIVDVEEEY